MLIHFYLHFRTEEVQYKFVVEIIQSLKSESGAAYTQH